MLKDDRSGEAIVHLIDIRSDATTDSLVRHDFDELMEAYGAANVSEFERHGRKITGKRLRVRGDTLMGEITYTFRSLEGIEGLRITKDGMSILFPSDRHVVRSNGKVSMTDKDETRIMWDLDAKRLTYEVDEKALPSSTSLAFLYQRYTH